MNKKNVFVLIFFFTISNVYTNKEVVNLTTSFSVLQQRDSISAKYLKAKKYFDNENYTESLRIAFERLHEDNLNSREEFYKLNFLIGKVFYATHNYENTLKYLKKAVSIYEEKILLNFDEKIKLDNSYEEELSYLESLLSIGSSYYKISLKFNDKEKLDSAMYYYKRVANFNSLNRELKLFKAKAFNNISAVFIKDSLYSEAKENLGRAIKIYGNLDNKTAQARTLANLSSVFLLEEDFKKAKETYFRAIDLIKDLDTDNALEIREALYYNLAYNLYLLKDYKAYDYQELSYLIKDSIRDKQFRGIIAEINEKYNFDVKKKLLLEEEENKRLKSQRSFWLASVVGVLIIFSLLYWVNFYKLKQKNLSLKLSQTELLQNQKLEKLRSESQTRILNATIDGKETERKQIAETLHDSVSALLSSANLHLQATKTAFNGKTPIEIDKTRDIITEASHKIRDLSHSLVSSILLKFGLKFAIKDMAKKYSNSQIEITTNIGSVRRYEQDFEIKVHNITQEFLNNILKHSKATEAKIELEEKDKKLYLKVTDNGKGFHKTKTINKDGLGINQIEARIIVMKGKFVIDSEIGKGTSISVEIPIKEKETIYRA